ncbi:MAG: cysteine desulfurase-like protein [Acidobacteriota bacterium]|nr:MAG: cysteine desulfurase-like protein [Acidobacteriota bacterium]
MDFPLDYVRGCFPSLQDSDTIYFDNIEAPQSLGTVRTFENNGFDGGADELLRETRESLAFFLNSNVEWAAEEILIASDATVLADRLSRALARSYPPDSEIVTTELDDEESLAPWLALESNGVKVEQWPIRRQYARIDTDRLGEMLSERTRLVVMSKASSAVGSIVELLPVALGVQGHKSSLLVNWSAFLPHGAVDVRFLRTDFLIASTRLFCGANVGFLWGSRERMRSLRKDAPELFDAASVEPKKLAGFGAALRYIEELGLVTDDMQLQPSEDYGRRRHMRRGMQAIRHYERSLTALALRRLQAVPGATVYGISDPDAAAHRIPHILFRLDGLEPKAIAAALAEKEVRVSHGSAGAPRLMKSLGLPEDEGGCVLSLLHYNTEKEIERFAEALHEIALYRAAVSG